MIASGLEGVKVGLEFVTFNVDKRRSNHVHCVRMTHNFMSIWSISLILGVVRYGWQHRGHGRGLVNRE